MCWDYAVKLKTEQKARRLTMKSATGYLWFNTEKHREFINITDKVEGLVERSGIAEGFVLVSAMHITAGVYVNDAEPGLIADIDEWVEKLAPYRPVRWDSTECHDP
jgi:thiamine phosphate synthase YjbQ (UPF0047 family)